MAIYSWDFSVWAQVLPNGCCGHLIRFSQIAGSSTETQVGDMTDIWYDCVQSSFTDGQQNEIACWYNGVRIILESYNMFLHLSDVPNLGDGDRKQRQIDMKKEQDLRSLGFIKSHQRQAEKVRNQSSQRLHRNSAGIKLFKGSTRKHERVQSLGNWDSAPKIS